MAHLPLFIVCVGEGGSPAQRAALDGRLAGWRAKACLPNVWLIMAPTIARNIYDSLADVLEDRGRLLVAELAGDMLWFNLEKRPDQGVRPDGAAATGPR